MNIEQLLLIKPHNSIINEVVQFCFILLLNENPYGLFGQYMPVAYGRWSSP
jgi:hypothetical protein